jgi:predicted nucleic acid-binding Zn ribbon protein
MTDSGKWCTSCREWLPLEAFGPRAELRSGFDSWCRSCRGERVRQWRAENPKYLADYNAKRRAEYRADHPVPTRACVVCGEPHSRQPRALVCSERCRNERKREQRRQRMKAAA